MKLCVLGAGGLGSVLGGFLAKSGVDVTLVCRPAHADAINKKRPQTDWRTRRAYCTRTFDGSHFSS